MSREVGASVAARFDFVLPEGFVIAPSSAFVADDALMRQAFGHGVGLGAASITAIGSSPFCGGKRTSILTG
jgi:hypothetical protein